MPSSTEKATESVLASPEAAKDAAAQIESKLPKLSGGESAKESADAIKGELTAENVRSINEYVRNAIDSNGVAGKVELQLVMMNALANTPDLKNKFPALCNELNRLGCLDGKA